MSSYIDGKKKGEDSTLKWHYMKKEHWDQFVCDHTTLEALVSTKISIILNVLYVFLYVFLNRKYHIILIFSFMYFFSFLFDFAAEARKGKTKRLKE